MIILLNLIFSYTAKSIYKEPECDRLFNTGWKFTRDSLSGAEKPEFDDSKWITVDLIYDTPNPQVGGKEDNSCRHLAGLLDLERIIFVILN